jgi:hypothetical protein
MLESRHPVRIDMGRGAPTYVTVRTDGGVILNQGRSHIMLGPDELAAVIDAVQSQRPKRAEKTTNGASR